MCGRYAQSLTTEEIEQAFQIIRGPTTPDIVPSWNVAPTQTGPVVGLSKGERVLRAYRWGLVPKWAKDPKIGHKAINARADTVAERPMFRSAFAKRRCLVPATGFYEWQRTADGKVPHYVHPARAQLFAFAGLWERWTPPDGGDELRTYTIITVDPNTLMAKIHDRMPVIVPKRAWAAWLDPETSPEDLQALLVSLPAPQMRSRVVSTAVNSPAHDGPELIEAA
ncbi:MAG: hypothetical protein JWM10_3470 [Myxococcaceae bacterium]|nr:hypothetical protein [Myxococcaceae bacterium]